VTLHVLFLVSLIEGLGSLQTFLGRQAKGLGPGEETLTPTSTMHFHLIWFNCQCYRTLRQELRATEQNCLIGTTIGSSASGVRPGTDFKNHVSSRSCNPARHSLRAHHQRHPWVGSRPISGIRQVALLRGPVLGGRHEILALWGKVAWGRF